MYAPRHLVSRVLRMGVDDALARVKFFSAYARLCSGTSVLSTQSPSSLSNTSLSCLRPVLADGA